LVKYIYIFGRKKFGQTKCYIFSQKKPIFLTRK